MAESCYNIIEITGNKDCLEVIKKKFLTLEEEKSTSIMESLIGLGDIPDDYYNQGWYHYNINRFGTKCDFSWSDCIINFSSESIKVEVETAYHPPIEFLSELCRMYNVEATIDYDEPVSDMGGRAVFETTGDYYDDRLSYLESKYINSKDDFWDIVETMIELNQYDDFEELAEKCEFLSENENEKLEELWNEKNDQDSDAI